MWSCVKRSTRATVWLAMAVRASMRVVKSCALTGPLSLWLTLTEHDLHGTDVHELDDDSCAFTPSPLQHQCHRQSSVIQSNLIQSNRNRIASSCIQCYHFIPFYLFIEFYHFIEFNWQIHKSVRERNNS